MKVLHLISNHKLTGPVDPAIRLARAIRDLSVDSRVAVGRPRPGTGPIDDLVRERGLEPITDLFLPKHRRLLRNRADVRKLVSCLLEDPCEILHVHLDNAHQIAARARRELDLVAGARRPLIIRSLYDGTAPRRSARYRWLYGEESDGVIVFGEQVRRDLLDRFGLPPDRVVVMPGGVVTERFRPRPPEDDLRERFGLPRSAVVVGIVARIQRHRRFEILFKAMKRVMAELPDVYLLVLGRGTHAKDIAHATVDRLGIRDRTRLPGYVGGDDYPRAVACFDIKVFLVPGSDGTCRAVREAMACGIPVIAARRGLLPDIVRDGVDGLVIDDDVEGLAAAIRRLAADGELRRRMGRSALERAREEFGQSRQAEQVLESYRRWLDAAEAGASLPRRSGGEHP